MFYPQYVTTASTAVTIAEYYIPLPDATANYLVSTGLMSARFVSPEEYRAQYQQPPPTPAERNALEAQLRAEHAAYETQRRNWEAAQRAIRERAEALLVSCLNSAQRAQLAAQGSFEVRARSGRVYQIRRGRVQNVFELDGRGHAVRRLCAHPQDGVPDADTMLAQKLMIECHEEGFLALANVS
jgi:hypothetical protein